MTILLERQSEVIGSLGFSMAAVATANDSLHHAADALEQAFGVDASAVLADIINAAMGKCVLDPCLSDHDQSVPQQAEPAVMSVTQVVTGLEALLANPEVSAEAQNGVHMILGQLALAYSPQGYPMGRQRMRFGGVQNGLWRHGEAYFAAAREVIARHCQEDTCAYGGLNRVMAINPHDVHIAGWGKDIKKSKVRKQLASNLMLVGAALAERSADAEGASNNAAHYTDAVYPSETDEREDDAADSGLALRAAGDRDFSADTGLRARIRNMSWLTGSEVDLSCVPTYYLYEDGRSIAVVVDLAGSHSSLGRIATLTRSEAAKHVKIDKAVAHAARRAVQGGQGLKPVTGTSRKVLSFSQRYKGGHALRIYVGPAITSDAGIIVPLVAITSKQHEMAVLRTLNPRFSNVKKVVRGRHSAPGRQARRR